jgi:crossover junction endodeoxyribonuclease RuvC
MSSVESVVLGIDPGLSGALAFLNETTDRIEAVYDMPLMDGDRRDEVDFLALVSLVEKHNPRLAVTEDVWGVAGCGAKSSFNFGAAYGCMIGAFRYMRRPPLKMVRPQVWQAAMIGASKDTKAASRSAALCIVENQQAPGAVMLYRGKGRKPDHNRCDAVCIAAYASDTWPHGSGR